MTYNVEIAQASDPLRGKSVSPTEGLLDVPPPPADARARLDQTGVELKRGAFLNTIAMLASNFRGIFTFLVARLVGPAALGTFSVAWANVDLISKIAVFGLDNAITTFIARTQAIGDLARGRTLFRAAVVLVLIQSSLVAVVAIAALQMFGDHLQFPREMLSALAFVLCALPGIGLYRVCTSTSRGMKVGRATSELQSRRDLVCRLLLEKKKKKKKRYNNRTTKNITTKLNINIRKND